MRLETVVDSLEQDGLATVRRGAKRSDGHPTGVVAEELTPYAAGSGLSDADEVRVSLP